MKKLQSLSLALFALGLNYCNAQETTIPAGGNASGSGGTVSYSVGQVVYTTNTSTSGTVNQGVQQPYEIFPVSIREEETNVAISIFPNPAVNNLTLNIDELGKEELTVQLLDNSGKLISAQKVVGKQTQINTTDLAVATYFVCVVQHDRILKKFQIIKN